MRAATCVVASQRGDDATEIVASYRSMYGRPLPNVVRREVADTLGTFGPYKLAKYQSDSKKVKLRDVRCPARRGCHEGRYRRHSWSTERVGSPSLRLV